MNGIPDAVMVLVNVVVAPAAVYVVQALKQLTGWRGPRMAKVGACVAFLLGAGVAVVTGLATVGEVLSPLHLISGGGVSATLAGAIYAALKDRMGWSSSARG